MLIADIDGKSGQMAAGDLPFVVLLGEDCHSRDIVTEGRPFNGSSWPKGDRSSRLLYNICHIEIDMQAKYLTIGP